MQSPLAQQEIIAESKRAPVPHAFAAGGLGLERVGCLSAQVAELMANGETAGSLQAYVPETVRTGIGELWSLYLAGEIDRTELLTRFAGLWTDYAAENAG